MNSILGVDIGGVLIDRINDKTDTSFFGPNFLRTTAVPDGFEALRALRRQGWTVHLVSKCGPNVESKTRLWLAHHRFFELTGIPAANLHFCRTRPEKGPICEALGVSHFVDDRLDVLDCLPTVGRVYLFSPNPADRDRHGRGHRASRVEGWAELGRRLSTEPAKTATRANVKKL